MERACGYHNARARWRGPSAAAEAASIEASSSPTEERNESGQAAAAASRARSRSSAERAAASAAPLSSSSGARAPRSSAPRAARTSCRKALDAVKAGGRRGDRRPRRPRGRRHRRQGDARPRSTSTAAIDILVCNAGVGWKYGEENPGTMAGVHEASVENWRDVIGGVDLEGYFTMIHAALPTMLEQESGSIVSVASMAGLTGLYDAHAYTAAKGAIINLTRSMGDHLRETGRARQLRLPRLHRHADDRTGDRPVQGRGDQIRDGPDGPRRQARRRWPTRSSTSAPTSRATAPARRCWPTAAAPRGPSRPSGDELGPDRPAAGRRRGRNPARRSPRPTSTCSPGHRRLQPDARRRGVRQDDAVRRPRRPRPADLRALRRAARDRAARARDGRDQQPRRVPARRSTSATRSPSGSRSASSTRSATGRRWTSPGATRTATRSPRARWSSPPRAGVTVCALEPTCSVAVGPP